MLGLPWTVSAHAKDIWTTPDWEKREKLAEAEWAVTCTAANVVHLHALAPQREVELIYHGLDLRRFPVPCAAPSFRDGADPGDPVRLLSVGRLVEKKGTDVLIEALASLPKSSIGGSTMLAADPCRRRCAAWRKLAGWPRASAGTVRSVRKKFCTAIARRICSCWQAGSPLMVTAMACRMCCWRRRAKRSAVIASNFPGIAELVEDAVTGRLVKPADPLALAEELVMLIRDPALRLHLGRAGQERVFSRFSQQAGIERLAARFGLPTERRIVAAGGG